MKSLAFILGLLIASASAQAFTPGVPTTRGPHDHNIIDELTGAGNGALAGVTSGAREGLVLPHGLARLYIFTGANPAPDGGRIVWYEDVQPKGKPPICLATLSQPEPDYAGTYPVSPWPKRTTLQFSYWKFDTPTPALILDWDTQLLPFHAYSIDTYCQPKMVIGTLPQ